MSRCGGSNGGGGGFSAVAETPRNARPQISVALPFAAPAPGGATSGERQVLSLLQSCGAVVRHLAAFRCQDALAALEQLPSCQRMTGTTLAWHSLQLYSV